MGDLDEQQGNSFIVRKAGGRDVLGVCELLFALKRQYGSCVEDTLEGFRSSYEDGVWRVLGSGGNSIWIAEKRMLRGSVESSEILGFLSTAWRLVLRLGGLVGTLEEVYVDSRYRRKGVGYALWLAASEELRQKDVKTVEVVTSLAHPGQRQYAAKIGLQWYSNIHVVKL